MHGLPTAITPLGIFLLTTLPAPIIVLLPIVTPGKTETLAPIQTLSPIVIGRAISNPLIRCSLSIACPAVDKTQLGAIKTLSPIVTLAPSNIVVTL